MLVTRKYQIDLAPVPGSRTVIHPTIEAVQGDTDTHAVALALSESGSVWYPPDGAVPMVGYARSDGTGGTYDTLPDGSPACSIENNVVSAIIAAPMLAAAGPVRMTVYLLYADQKLHIFDTVIQVRPDPAADTVPPEDYINMQQWVASMAPQVVQNTGTSEQAVMSQRAVTDALARVIQHNPAFANSIEECTDTRQLYVLPDGFIYAYMASDSGYAWQSTGRAYQAADYEDRIIGLEDAVNRHKQQLPVLSARMDTAESGDPTALLPQYWQEHLNSKIHSVITRHRSGGKNTFSFPLLTDIHICSNLNSYSGMLAKAVMARCDIPYALCLGDLVTREHNDSEETMLEHFAAAEQLLAPLSGCLLRTQGAHDGSWGGTSDSSCANSKPQLLHSLIYRKAGLVGPLHFDADGCGYYMDDVSNKVRFLILSTHHNPYEALEDGTARYNNLTTFRFGQSQYDLVTQALTTVPGDDWAVVSASHVPLNNDYADAFGGAEGDHVLMRRLLAAYKKKTAFSGSFAGTYGADAASVEADFTKAKGTYVAHFSGCSHADTFVMCDDIRIITTRCDAPLEANEEQKAQRAAGTATEHSFDIVTVSLDSKMINITKIGAGNSRFMTF